MDFCWILSSSFFGNHLNMQIFSLWEMLLSKSFLRFLMTFQMSKLICCWVWSMKLTSKRLMSTSCSSLGTTTLLFSTTSEGSSIGKTNFSLPGKISIWDCSGKFASQTLSIKIQIQQVQIRKRRMGIARKNWKSWSTMPSIDSLRSWTTLKCICRKSHISSKLLSPFQ